MVDLSQYIELFVSEARGHLDDLDKAALALDADPNNKEAIDAFFRSGHTLKGMAGAMGFEQTYKLIHALETFMQPFREEKEKFSTPAYVLTSKALKATREILAAIEKTQAEYEVSASLIKALEGRELKVEESAPSQEEEISFASVDIRLKPESLEEMSRALNESLFRLSTLSEILSVMENAEIENLLSRLDGSLKTMQNYISELRLMPLELVLARAPSLARQAAGAVGKQVEITIRNPNIQVDRNVIEGLGQIIIHLIRNSVDHGIESSEERIAAGKSEKGNLLIECSKQEDLVTISIEDDGRGINAEKVIAKAVEKGLLLQEDTLAKTSWATVVELLCTPGFSTSEKVTTVSGRGVGLDVAREKITGLGGRFSLQSTPGKGTKFIIQIPVSLMRQKILLVEAGGSIYGIPMFDIDSIREGIVHSLEGGSMKIAFVNSSFHTEGFCLTCLLKQEANMLPPVEIGKTYDFITINSARGKLALWVDGILNGVDLITKSVAPPLDRVRFINTTALLADGSPLLILDINSLTERFREQYMLS